MNHKLLALACAGLAVLAAAGCKPDAPVEPAAPVAPAAVTPAASASDAAPVATTGAAPALDRKGFAGTFASADSAITLDPDGGFVLKDGQASFDGSWTAEADGARIRLDPNSKTEPDRLYAVVDRDEILPLDTSGEPLEGAVPLQRETTAD